MRTARSLWLLALALAGTGCLLMDGYDFGDYRHRGEGGAGQGGSAGAAGLSGASGQSGSSGAGQGGDSGSGGDAGSGGDSGSAGDSGSGGDSGQGGDSGKGGDAGSAGQGGSGGDSGQGGGGAGGAAGASGASGAGAGGASGAGAGGAGQGGASGTAGAGGAGAGGCAPAVMLYEDSDGDGFGNALKSKQGCGPEAGWSQLATDCNDTNKNVFPGQTVFFATPYEVSAGKMSYDYNCDNKEEGDPALKAAPTCSQQQPNACTKAKAGYVPSSKPGLGQNVLCGSTSTRSCVKDSGTNQCVDGSLVASDAYGCR